MSDLTSLLELRRDLDERLAALRVQAEAKPGSLAAIMMGRVELECQAVQKEIDEMTGILFSREDPSGRA